MTPAGAIYFRNQITVIMRCISVGTNKEAPNRQYMWHMYHHKFVHVYTGLKLRCHALFLISAKIECIPNNELLAFKNN